MGSSRDKRENNEARGGIQNKKSARYRRKKEYGYDRPGRAKDEGYLNDREYLEAVWGHRAQGQ